MNIAKSYGKKNQLKESKNCVFDQLIWIMEDGSLTYHFFRPTPYFREFNKYDTFGNCTWFACAEPKYTMDEMLEKIGWKTGFGGLTYREGDIGILMDCFLFYDAYKIIYYIYTDGSYKELNISLKSFIDEVVDKYKELSNSNNIKIDKIDLFLIKNNFEKL